MLLDMLKMSMRLVVSQKSIDRRNLLYNKKGHRQIQIKRVGKYTVKLDEEDMKLVDGRLERLYSRYDTLISMEF